MTLKASPDDCNNTWATIWHDSIISAIFPKRSTYIQTFASQVLIADAQSFPKLTHTLFIEFGGGDIVESPHFCCQKIVSKKRLLDKARNSGQQKHIWIRFAGPPMECGSGLSRVMPALFLQLNEHLVVGVTRRRQRKPGGQSHYV